jgi:hypothetical protein
VFGIAALNYTNNKVFVVDLTLNDILIKVKYLIFFLR